MQALCRKIPDNSPRFTVCPQAAGSLLLQHLQAATSRHCFQLPVAMSFLTPCSRKKRFHTRARDMTQPMGGQSMPIIGQGASRRGLRFRQACRCRERFPAAFVPGNPGSGTLAASSRGCPTSDSIRDSPAAAADSKFFSAATSRNRVGDRCPSVLGRGTPMAALPLLGGLHVSENRGT